MANPNKKWVDWLLKAIEQDMIQTERTRCKCGFVWHINSAYDTEEAIAQGTAWANSNKVALAALDEYAKASVKAKSSLDTTLRFKVDLFDPELHSHHPHRVYD